MCYSSTLRLDKQEIEKKLINQFNSTFDKESKYQPYFHLNGFSYGNLQIIKMDEPKRIVLANWGLVPDWAKSDIISFRKKSNTLNARGESIFDRSSFKESAANKRCLILADGFFEPHYQHGVSTPHFCYQPSNENPKGDLFLFAGLYNELNDNSFTATIITVEANDFFAEVHNKQKRMPLVLDEQYYKVWLDVGMSKHMVNELIATSFTNKEFKAHPVSRDLYKRGINTNQEYIIEEVEESTLF